MKLRDKARLVNQKLGHPEMQFMTTMHSNGLFIASMEGAEAHLPCVKLGKRERTKILQDTIVQRDVELTALRVVCTELEVRLSSIEEQLDSLMGQQKKHTIAFQSSPLHEYINKACSSLSSHLHNGR